MIFNLLNLLVKKLEMTERKMKERTSSERRRRILRAASPLSDSERQMELFAIK